jgi:hypothetical protein
MSIDPYIHHNHHNNSRNNPCTTSTASTAKFTTTPTTTTIPTATFVTTLIKAPHCTLGLFNIPIYFAPGALKYFQMWDVA